MALYELVKLAVLAALEQLRQGGVKSWVVAAVAFLLFMGLGIFAISKIISYAPNSIGKVFAILFYGIKALINSAAFTVIAVILTAAEEVADGYIGEVLTKFGNRFYIELIIAAALYGGLLIFIIWLKNGDMEEPEEIAKAILKALLVIIVSTLAIFTTWSVRSIGFLQFNVFKHTAAEWLYRFYNGYIVFIVIGLAREILMLPFARFIANIMSD
ncbi:MAG: hypothetical protein LBN30_07275 [Oscillospiraceae bacterium]|jgi:hypothetical protein|nr:hypothetical protein [Oscillospiraceae bacterium]